jgi:signal transduction histidine kinase/DNA-binding LacI/PurR family transcriptional regulator
MNPQLTTRLSRREGVPLESMPRDRGRQARVRPVIGMVTSGPLMELGEEQWLGVHEAAQANDCDLISFVGHELGHPDAHVRQANAVYDLVSADLIDALVVWTTKIGLLVDLPDLEQFLGRYAPIPIVCVERQVSGRPTVLMDNRYGMDQAVSHLIEVHGHRRIAFVRGPDTHGGAQDRYQGYVDALTRHGLPVDADLVTPPGPWDWNPDAAAEAVSKMLNRVATPPDAIAAANDDFAVGVLTALEAAGFRTPDDVAVVGFDNHTNIRSRDLGYEVLHRGDPATAITRTVNVHAGTVELTTARAPFYEMGRRAVELALGLVRGQTVPSVDTAQTELVVRRSCGCFPAAHGDTAPARREEILSQPRTEPDAAVEGMRLALGSVSSALPDGWADRLVSGFLEELTGRAEGRFLPRLAEYVRASVRAGGAPLAWWQAVFELRRLALSRITVEPEALAPAEDLWLRVQLLLAETTQSLGDYRYMVEEKRNKTLRDVGRHLVAASDASALADALADELPKIGIPSCYLVSYQFSHPVGGPVDPEPGNEAHTARSRLLLAYENGSAGQIAPEAAVFRSDRLVPGERLRTVSPYSMVAAPLYFKDEQLGYALFQLGPRIGWIYAALQDQLSIALHRASLAERERAAWAALAQVHRREERQRLAAELHDSVSQALFSMTLHTRALQLVVQQQGDDPQGKIAHGLAELRELTQGALTEMRALIFQLRPDVLREEGLVTAIRRHAGTVAAQEGIEVRVNAPDDRLPLSERTEHELFRVVQEALHNSVKHAHPKRVDIRLTAADGARGTLVVEVADDGVGFDPNIPRPGHMGLENMRERTHRIGGRFTIDSSSTVSTTVRVVLPDALREG